MTLDALYMRKPAGSVGVVVAVLGDWPAPPRTLTPREIAGRKVARAAQTKRAPNRIQRRYA